ncbi:MAG: hypothetical protein AAF514_10060, partial [Verrucomicrobiota bacterium]
MKTVWKTVCVVWVTILLALYPWSLEAQDVSAQEGEAFTGNEGTFPYQTDFTDFEPGDLGGQHGWAVERGTAVVVRGPGAGMDDETSLRLEPSNPYGQVSLYLEARDQGPVVFTDFFVKPVAFREEVEEFADLSGAVTGFFRVEEDGELFVLDGDGVGGGQWVSTGAKLPVDEDGKATDFIRLTFRQDFKMGLWDIYVDGEMRKAGLGLWDNRQQAVERFTLTGHTRHALILDRLVIQNENMLFDDENRNGLPDLWESDYQLESEGIRGADSDGDGLSNLKEFIARTAPDVADTDGDGLTDAEELEEGRNPRDPSDGPKVARNEGRRDAAGRERAENDPLAVEFETDLGVSIVGVSCAPDMVKFRVRKRSDFNDVLLQVRGLIWDQDYYLLSLDIDPGVFRGEHFIDIKASSHRNNIRSGGFFLTFTATRDGQTYTKSLYEPFSCCLECGCHGVAIGSADFQFGLGKTDCGDRALSIGAYSETLSDDLYSRSSLFLSDDLDSTSVRYGVSKQPAAYEKPAYYPILTQPLTGERGSKQVLEEVRSAQTVARLHDLWNGYQVRLHPAGAPHGAPYETISVTNPDPTGLGAYRRLRIERKGGRPLVSEYRHRVIPSERKEIWELLEGESKTFLRQPLKRTLRVTTWPEFTAALADETEASFEYTVRTEKSGWNTATGEVEVVSVEEETFVRLFYGDRLIKRVVDPDGKALTTRWGIDRTVRLADMPANLEDWDLSWYPEKWVRYPNQGWTRETCCGYGYELVRFRRNLPR